MLSVDEARARVLALARLTDSETLPLRQAAGRVLAEPVTASHDQPPFRTATMDGYAIFGEACAVGHSFAVVGTAQAGKGYGGTLAKGQAIRIFTGAPVPAESARVIIQEDVATDGDRITLNGNLDPGANIRAVGADFRRGQALTPRRLSPFEIALAAAMNHGTLPLRRRPEVAIVATGDELVEPGTPLGADQIIASNSHGIAALIERQGGRARLLPIARDTPESLRATLALAGGADLILTIGGASVGDHDLVKSVAGDMGLALDFWKIAMRPGKPLLAGRLNGVPMIGLPGNPVSALVCSVLFVLPLIDAMLGLPAINPERHAPLAEDVPANGPRAHYMRATLGPTGLVPAKTQDSALLSIMADASALLIRPPHDGPRKTGEMVPYLPL